MLRFSAGEPDVSHGRASTSVVANGVAVAAGEDLLASIVEGFPQPIWLVDGQGVTLFTNMAAAQSLGYDDPSELIGRPSHDMVHYKRPSGEFYPGEEW